MHVQGTVEGGVAACKELSPDKNSRSNNNFDLLRNNNSCI